MSNIETTEDIERARHDIAVDLGMIPGEEPRQRKEPWQIRGESSAAYAMAKVARAEQEVLRIKAHAKEARAALATWVEEHSSGPVATQYFFGQHLLGWHRAHVEALAEQVGVDITNPAKDEWTKRVDRKTANYLHGAVKAIRHEAKYVVTDPEEYAEHMMAVCGMVEPLDVPTSLVGLLTVTIGATPPKFDDPRFRVVTADDEVGVEFSPAPADRLTDWEVVPGLSWAAAYIDYTVTPNTKIELPGYMPDDDTEEVDE